MTSPTVTGCDDASGALAGSATTGVDATTGALAEFAGEAGLPAVADVSLVALEEPSLPSPHPATMKLAITPATSKQRLFFFMTNPLIK